MSRVIPYIVGFEQHGPVWARPASAAERAVRSGRGKTPEIQEADNRGGRLDQQLRAMIKLRKLRVTGRGIHESTPFNDNLRETSRRWDQALRVCLPRGQTGVVLASRFH